MEDVDIQEKINTFALDNKQMDFLSVKINNKK